MFAKAKDSHNTARKPLRRLIVGATLLAVAAPAVLAAPAVSAAAPAPDQNGYLGVHVEVKNRSHSKPIYVKDRNNGQVKMIPGGASASWAEDFKRVHDEVELNTYYDHRVDDPGIEMDGSNPAAGWPTFSVDGDVENFSQDEMKVFNPGDGGRYVVTRIGDSDDHKRFVVEVTPPGPIDQLSEKPTPRPAEQAPQIRQAVASHAAPAPDRVADQGQPQEQRPESWTKGTHVVVKNTGDQPIWIQNYWPGPPGKWSKPLKLAPGERESHSGDYPVIDDCEMRAFFSEADALAEENNVDIDAENPSYATPWLSVDWDSEAMGVGDKHTWITDEGHRFDGERVSDSDDYKEFRVAITPR